MKAKKTKLALWICAIVVLLVASILVPSVQKTETIQVTMRDAVLHETNRISLFGIKDVNPALISAMVVSGSLLVFAGHRAAFSSFRALRWCPESSRCSLSRR